MTTEKAQASRRKFIKRAAYLPPAILTLAVVPSYAKAGSEKEVVNGSGYEANGNGNGNGLGKAAGRRVADAVKGQGKGKGN